MDGTEVNLVLEGDVWKWMGLAALWCNKRNESSNRLSVNSIRDTLTLHKPFIMMMPRSEIFQRGSQSLVLKGTLRDGWSTKVHLGLVYCHSPLFLWRFESFQPINQWRQAFQQATLSFSMRALTGRSPLKGCLKTCMFFQGHIETESKWNCNLMFALNCVL